MNGGHDLGGRQGFGSVNAEPESEEPLFHAEWERRIFALTLATGMLGQWNIDESRHARERQHPADYLKHSYYENWLVGLEKLLAEKDLVARIEQDAQCFQVPDAAAARKILRTGGPTLLPDSTQPRFRSGDRVRVARCQHSGHTRAPTYVQGASGTVVDHYGTHIYPDQNATGQRAGEHLYCVRFEGTELWGSESSSQSVYVDLWEPYLEEIC